MSERQWLTSSDPFKMLEKSLPVHYFENEAGRRKLNLFAVACCRRVWGRLSPESQELFAALEETADQKGLSSKRVKAAFEQAERAYDDLAFYFGYDDFGMVTHHTAELAASAVGPEGTAAFRKTYRAESRGQANLLREIFGNPFRPAPKLDASLLTLWVETLAQDIYVQRGLPEGTLDPARLALLADALEAAACADAEIPGHLRSPGPHVRGCWALDLIAGRS